ncbi:hypothetical protein [Litorimonas haliclonae]|uniref:hypothetical protein n=1 Tax=Litorimonas haliclonae TaxID=2081977 RepID=UPI0039EF26D5
MNAYFDLFIYAEADRALARAPEDSRLAAEVYKQGAPALAPVRAVHKPAALVLALAHIQAAAGEGAEDRLARQPGRNKAHSTGQAVHIRNLNGLSRILQSHTESTHMLRQSHVRLRNPLRIGYWPNGLNRRSPQDCRERRQEQIEKDECGA